MLQRQTLSVVDADGVDADGVIWTGLQANLYRL